MACRCYNYFDGLCAQGLDEWGRGGVVGDDGVHAVEVAEGEDGAALEFGVVEAEDDAVGGIDHGELDIYQKAVGIRDPFECDSTGAHDGHVSVHLREGFDGGRSDQYSDARVDYTAGDKDLHLIRRCEEIGDREGVGD